MHFPRNAFSSIVVLLIASSAVAQTKVWFTSGLAGGEDQILDLTCDTSGPAGICSYSIDMYTDGDDAVGLIAWASNLHSGSEGDCVTASWQGPPSPIPPPPGGNGGCGSDLLSGFQGQAFGEPITGTVSILSMSLSHAYVMGETGTSIISESAGDGSTGVVWASGAGDYAVVSFAGGPALPHPENSPGGTVIRITNVPEPSALALAWVVFPAAWRRRQRTIARP
jgi:hypothetical protein